MFKHNYIFGLIYHYYILKLSLSVSGVWICRIFLFNGLDIHNSKCNCLSAWCEYDIFHTCNHFKSKATFMVLNLSVPTYSKEQFLKFIVPLNMQGS